MNPWIAKALVLTGTVVMIAIRAPHGHRSRIVKVATSYKTPLETGLLVPQDVPFFGKLLQREIIYRLLQGPQGGRLRSVATKEDQSYLTAKAVTWLRENFEKTLNVDELASMAGMSRSTLHHHFRGLTAMSPLQFQKQLRLRTARQKMLTEELDAASAAFAVGYESPSQFNREYKRFFGKPPMRDVQALRASL
jgi:AraC-like DNA-binding protein